jgi:peptidoglycan hydrolase-like protein with peptidoglycan-binding domain
MYRELARTSPRLEGADVEQLQRFLLGQGFDDEGRLEADGVFGYSTERAVEDWQESLGVDETGRVGPTQVVFSPTPLRIAADARVGSAFAGLEVTEAAPIVTVDTDSADRDLLPIGNPVSVELADGTELTGVVSNQERALLDDGTAVWRTTIDLDDQPPADASSVLVHSAVTVEEDVLIVPVGALLALAEGGFAVEVVDGSSAGLVAVEVGTVIGGLAEISGAVEPGDEVVVAS